MSLFDQGATTYDPSLSFIDNLKAALPPEDMANALGFNNIDQAAQQANAANPPAPAAPQFGQGASPFQFPQSAAFGAPMPAPAAPAPIAPAVANANAAANDDENDPIAVGNNYQMPRIGSGFPDDTAPAPRPQQSALPAAAPPHWFPR